MNKAIFLDKDGTLIPDIPYNVDPTKIELGEGVGEVLHRLQQHGYKLVVISNQSGVAKGYFEEKKLIAVKRKLDELLAKYNVTLDGWYYCPHYIQGVVPTYTKICDCRKPNTGMFKKAIKDLQIKTTESWMIGDILNDVEAGKRAGCNTILLDVQNETEWRVNRLRRPDYLAHTFYDVERIIMYEHISLFSHL